MGMWFFEAWCLARDSLEFSDASSVSNLHIPYAPIPSASGFGAGFGCLNTFSKGVWSTRVFFFLKKPENSISEEMQHHYNTPPTMMNNDMLTSLGSRKSHTKKRSWWALEQQKKKTSRHSGAFPSITILILKYRSKVHKRTLSEM